LIQISAVSLVTRTRGELSEMELGCQPNQHASDFTNGVTACLILPGHCIPHIASLKLVAARRVGLL